MSTREDVENSKLHFVPAKTPEYKRGKPNFVETVNLNNGRGSEATEFHFKDMGEVTNEVGSSYAMRKEYSSGQKKYFVKFATAGSATGKMLNPWGSNYQPGDEFKFETQMGRKKYEFREVDENIFNTYMQFLRTRNERYILTAEREVNNAR